MKSASLVLFLCVAGILISPEATAQMFGVRKYVTVQNGQKKKKERLPFSSRKKLFSAYTKRYIAIGGAIHALHYMGDIAPQSYFTPASLSSVGPGLAISSTVRLNARLALRGEFLYGRLRSSDYALTSAEDPIAVYRYVRDLQFRNTIKDLSLVGSYDLFSSHSTIMYRTFFTPYFLGGISIFHHNPKALVPQEAVLYPGEITVPEEAGKWVPLRPLKTEGQSHPYSAFQLSIPMGIGVRMKLTELIDIETEVSYRYLFTDYLDDISKNYVDKGILESELAKVLSDRSLETTDVLSGEERVDALLGEARMRNSVITYAGADGKQYAVIAGYGQAGQIRGSPKYNDGFMTASIRLVMILGESPWAQQRR